MSLLRRFNKKNRLVPVAVAALLVSFAIPRMQKTQTEAHMTKSLENIHAIGSAILAAYGGIATEGDANANAIPTFSIASNTILDTIVQTGPEVISFGHDGRGSITVRDLFQNGGPPTSPFDRQFYVVTDVTSGKGNWVALGNLPILNLDPRPSITIADPTYTNIRATFRPYD